MKKTKHLAISPDIEKLIVTLRGQKVILDADLARIYGVATRSLNQAVKRNSGRFPPDFLFRATPEELDGMRSQSVTGSRRNVRHLPYAFTEHGAIMAANILNSPRAVEMSVFVVRAFVKMRSSFGDSRELAQKLALLEKELKIRLNIHESAFLNPSLSGQWAAISGSIRVHLWLVPYPPVSRLTASKQHAKVNCPGNRCLFVVLLNG